MQPGMRRGRRAYGVAMRGRIRGWRAPIVGLALALGCAERRVIVADPVTTTPSVSASPAPSVGPPVVRLVVHARIGLPLRVEGCVGSAPCAEWVRFPTKPPRAMVQADVAPSGRHFFLWTRADGHARELDVYEVPTSGKARRTAHMVPGAGGLLRWVDGDRLFHHWGCGTGCAEVRVRDTHGAILVATDGAWIEEDGTARAAVVGHGGDATWIEFVTGTGWTGPKVPGLLFPSAVRWEPGALRITHETSTGGEVVRLCRQSLSGAPTGPKRTLHCVPA